MAETYIFRFRDLGKKEGYTIAEHQQIAEKKQFVWWGWWAKAGECFPKSDLEKALENQPCNIFLFDSGQSKFYQANLMEVDASASGHKKKPAPNNGDYTPDYYKDDELRGWLKISTITEIPSENVLKKYSYVQFDNMYPDISQDLDEQLFNKIVFSSIELVKQNRTIWKIRTANKTDLQHESLATHYTPYNFVRRYSQKESTVIAWLSDIHFDNGGGKHQFPFIDSAQHKCLSTRVTELLDKSTNGLKCAGLAISGDITWQSQTDGFNRAEEFIKDISSSQSLSEHDLIICPGNHDVGFINMEEYESYTGIKPSPEQWVTLASELHDTSKNKYENFYGKIFLRRPEASLAQGRKFLLGGHKIVEIAAINSCMLQQVTENFKGIGFIGEAQLSSVENSMGWCNQGSIVPKKQGVIRIVMLHHHLTPINEVEDGYLDARYSVTLDAERLMRWVVKHKVDYVLHGHMHRCNEVTITRKIDSLKELCNNKNPEHTFKIISLGSSGVSSTELPDQDRFNYVCIIDFSDERPTFKFFSLCKQTEVATTPSYVLGG